MQNMRTLPIPLIPVREQEVLVERILGILFSIRRQIDRHESLSETLLRLDQSILAKAFRGELVAQDPNDEPASVLLDRIKAERAAMETTRKNNRKSSSRRKAK